MKEKFEAMKSNHNYQKNENFVNEEDIMQSSLDIITPSGFQFDVALTTEGTVYEIVAGTYEHDEHGTYFEKLETAMEDPEREVEAPNQDEGPELD